MHHVLYRITLLELNAISMLRIYMLASPIADELYKSYERLYIDAFPGWARSQRSDAVTSGCHYVTENVKAERHDGTIWVQFWQKRTNGYAASVCHTCSSFRRWTQHFWVETLPFSSSMHLSSVQLAITLTQCNPGLQPDRPKQWRQSFITLLHTYC